MSIQLGNSSGPIALLVLRDASFFSTSSTDMEYLAGISDIVGVCVSWGRSLDMLTKKVFIWLASTSKSPSQSVFARVISEEVGSGLV